MISFSRPSGGVVFLRNLTLSDSSAAIDVWLIFLIFLCEIFVSEEW